MSQFFIQSGAMHALITVDLLIALALFLCRLPMRQDRRGQRRLAAAAFVAVFLALPPLVTDTTDLSSTGSLVFQLAFYTAVLALMTLLVTLLCEVNIWTALFCSTAAYTAQNTASCANMLVMYLVLGRSQDVYVDPAITISFVACNVVTLVAFWMLFVRKMDLQTLCDIHEPKMLLLFAVVSLGIIGFDLLVKSFTDGDVALVQAVLLRAVHLSVCLFVLLAEFQILYQQKARAESAALEQLLAERSRQYEDSRKNIEAINVKCHDIRHQLQLLTQDAGEKRRETLASIAAEVDIYDSNVTTGNEALDTILSEERLSCRNDQINFSCIADGRALAFVSPADLYSLFGNALDNAISASRNVPEVERRSISLVVRRKGDMACVHIENRFTGEVAFRDGLPQATRTQTGTTRHGLGARSMCLMAKKYRGAIAFQADSGVFMVDITLPIPQE